MLIFFGDAAMSQLTTATSMTPTQLVEDVLVGNGVAVSNVSYTGSANAIGSFNGASTNLGLAHRNCSHNRNCFEYRRCVWRRWSAGSKR